MRWVALVLLSIHLASCAPAEERIHSLPNLVEPMRSRQYSGYLDISEVKSLYYWYIESENDPLNDPVFLWLNGGPGCSSLEGLFQEMGPYRTHDYGASIQRNPWTWNRYASIIYLDAPAGVGFSLRTDNKTNWKYTDDEVAQDNYNALKLWFMKFAERKSNDFYIAGESYGGTYVPMLSALIAKDPLTFPSFKGMMVGNGCVDDKLLINSAVGFNYYHGFMDERLYAASMNKCCSGATFSKPCDFFYMLQDSNHACYSVASDLVYSNYNPNVDPYLVYYSCYLNPQDHPDQATNPLNYRTAIVRRHLRNRNFKNYQDVTCDHYDDSTHYLQMDSVRKALRIPDIVPKYQSCSNDISKNYDNSIAEGTTHVISQHSNVLTVVNANKRVMFFNGDTDSICPHTHNAQFVANLGLPKIADQTYWEDYSQLPSTIGMITRYQGVDYLTVRGAGHFVSSSSEKPKEALQMFVNFIRNQNYSTSIESDTPASSTFTPPIKVSTTSGTTRPTVTTTLAPTCPPAPPCPTLTCPTIKPEVVTVVPDCKGAGVVTVLLSLIISVFVL